MVTFSSQLTEDHSSIHVAQVHAGNIGDHWRCRYLSFERQGRKQAGLWGGTIPHVGNSQTSLHLKDGFGVFMGIGKLNTYCGRKRVFIVITSLRSSLCIWLQTFIRVCGEFKNLLRAGYASFR
jgi:hypothetical protein